MFANRFEWQEKLARTQSPPCNLSLFFSVFLSLTQVFALHCNHVHVHGGCFLSVAGRQIASIWLKGICYISPQHEKCRHTHTSFFFPFECLEMMFVYLDFICQSRQRPHCAFANKSALMVQLHYILIICCFMMKKHIPRGYTFLWQPTIYVPFAVLYVRPIQNVIFSGSHFKCLRASCTHFIFMCGHIYLFDLC